MTQPTAETVAQWREICEFLDKLPYKAAYDPPHSHLLGPKNLQFRKDNPMVWWCTGWGWRLRKQWRETLERLEKEQSV